MGLIIWSLHSDHFYHLVAHLFNVLCDNFQNSGNLSGVFGVLWEDVVKDIKNDEDIHLVLLDHHDPFSCNCRLYARWSLPEVTFDVPFRRHGSPHVPSNVHFIR